MTPLSTWLRRGVGAPAAVTIASFLLTTLLPQQDWLVEFDWATRLSAASVIVISPCVAAAAAFETASRWHPTLAALAVGSPRRGVHASAAAGAVAVWVLGAFLVLWIVAAVMVFRHGGVGVTDWWVFAEVATPVWAAAMVGAAVGVWVRSRWAPLAAACAVLATTVLASPWGRGPFEAVTTYGTLTGLERAAERSVASIGGALVVGVSALVIAHQGARPFPARRALVIGATITAMLVTIAAPAWPWNRDIYVVSSEPTACVGSHPSVCGPESRVSLFEPVQSALAGAYRTLEGTEFVRPAAFRVIRVDHYEGLDGAAPLEFDPTFIRGGTYDRGEVAQALVRPHQCRELFDAEDSVPILEAHDVLLPWLKSVLGGQTPARPVPPEVRRAFDVVLQCSPMETNLR